MVRSRYYPGYIDSRFYPGNIASEEDDMAEKAFVAFIGDDLPDLPVLGRCGLSFAPADAVAEVRAVVHRVLGRRGGDGAAREMIELILRARGEWRQVLARYSLGG